MTNLTARVRPSAALGTLLLLISGALLAGDVAITRILATEEPSLAENGAATSGSHDTVSPQSPCAINHTCENVVAHSHDLAHTSSPAHATASQSLNSQSLNARAMPHALKVRLPILGGAPFITAARYSVLASLPEKMQSANAENANDASRDYRFGSSVSSPARTALVSDAPVAVREVARQPEPAPRQSSPNSAMHSPVQRSAEQRARLAVIQMVKAQTPGVQWISAGAHKKGRDRLIVRVVAHTKTATFYEYDVLRCNGIGFAVEQRKFRTVNRAHATTAVREPGP